MATSKEPGYADIAAAADDPNEDAGGAHGANEETPRPRWIATLERNVAKNRKLPYAKYIQLATVAADGTPRCRTVVYRGLRRELKKPQRLTDDLVFCTDRRSEKMQQLSQNIATEICWYFPESREQLRIQGRCFLVGGDETSPQVAADGIREVSENLPPSASDLVKLRRSLWKAMSEGAREQFDWAHPKAPLGSGEVAEKECDEDGVSENFVYALVVPSYVDHLTLKGNPQTRSVHYRDGCADAKSRALSVLPGDQLNEVVGGWTSLSVNP